MMEMPIISIIPVPITSVIANTSSGKVIQRCEIQ